MVKQLYCHTNGYMKGTEIRFATKGKYYEITGECIDYYEIIDDEGDTHSFDKDSFQQWFKLAYEDGEIEEAIGEDNLKNIQEIIEMQYKVLAKTDNILLDNHFKLNKDFKKRVFENIEFLMSVKEMLK